MKEGKKREKNVKLFPFFKIFISQNDLFKQDKNSVKLEKKNRKFNLNFNLNFII